MRGMERVIAALLLAVAVAGGALIPRLLSVPARPLGVPLGPGPSRVVVQAPPAITKAPRHATRPHGSPLPAKSPPVASSASVAPVATQPAPSAGPASKPSQQHRKPPPPSPP